MLCSSHRSNGSLCYFCNHLLEGPISTCYHCSRSFHYGCAHTFIDCPCCSLPSDFLHSHNIKKHRNFYNILARQRIVVNLLFIIINLPYCRIAAFSIDMLLKSFVLYDVFMDNKIISSTGMNCTNTIELSTFVIVFLLLVPPLIFLYKDSHYVTTFLLRIIYL